MRLSRRRNVYAAVTAAVLVSSVMVAGAASASGNTRVTMSGSVPSWAHASRAVGIVAASTKVSFSVVLPLRDAAGAAQVAASVSNPDSSSYGHYLTPAQFNSRFAPTTAQVTKVKAYLRAQGFKVSSVAQGNRWVSATGTVSQVNRAFGVTMRNYSYHGRALKSPDKNVSLPSSLKGVVSGIAGLDDSGLLRRPDNVRLPRLSSNGRFSSGATPKATPNAVTPMATAPAPVACSDYWAQHSQKVPSAYGKTSYPTWICGYTPAQLRGAYRVPGTGRTGKGVTVAIIDAYASPTMKADANRYAASMGDPQFTTGQYTEQVFKPFTLQNECGGEPGWNGEEAIDVEAVHAMATGAKILYVGASNCDDGINDAINWIVQTHAASIVSDSWGATGEFAGTDYQIEKSLFTQAVAEGIGFYFSSGDDGDEYLAGWTSEPQPDYPASDANVTAVGGTSLAVNKSNTYQFETGWGTFVDTVNFNGSTAAWDESLPGEFWFGGGGGVSTLTPQPAYQARIVPSRLSRSRGPAAMRVVPDVAANADPFTGMVIGWSDTIPEDGLGGAYTLETWGGTSLACPLFAGMQALANQNRKVDIGFANPLLYQAPALTYNDVRPPSTTIAVASSAGDLLATFNHDSSLTTGRYYDDVTGRGSPIAPLLVKAEGVPTNTGMPVLPPPGWPHRAV